MSTTINTADAEAVLRAYRVMLQYNLVDVFCLTPEESLWVEHHLTEALLPLARHVPTSVPLAVRQEMVDHVYSDMLSYAQAHPRTPPPVAAVATTQASKEDWVAAIMDSIRRCWSLRPMDDAALAGKLGGLLVELGVGSGDNPRASTVLPLVLRDRLNTPVT